MNEKTISSDFESFLNESREKVNVTFNHVLWICIVAGPLIAIAVKFKIFAGVTYLTAFIVSLFMFTLAMIHRALLKHRVASLVTSILALFAIDILLFVMDSAHLTIYITWFLIPLLSLQFCDFKLYFITVVVNYDFMVAATWHMAPYFAERRIDIDTPMSYFAQRLGGLSVEMLVMICAGYALCKMIIRYYKNLIEKAAVVSKDRLVLERIDAELKAMADDYIWVQDIDVSENTFDIIHTSNEKVDEYMGDSHSNAKQLLYAFLDLMLPKQGKEEVLKFVDFSNLDERMGDKRSISVDFQNSKDEWLRGRFVVSGRDESGKITHVIWLVEELKDRK